MSGPLQKYRYVGKGRETVLKLNEADARRLGLGPADVVEPGAMQGEPGPETLAFSGDEGTVAKQKSPSPNKARQTSANKGGRAPRKTTPPVQAPADEPQGQGGDEKQAAPQGGGDGGPGGGD